MVDLSEHVGNKRIFVSKAEHDCNLNLICCSDPTNSDLTSCAIKHEIKILFKHPTNTVKETAHLICSLNIDFP
ncbi:hypothetical protein CUMW_006240, partial [Citrus unshiu]